MSNAPREEMHLTSFHATATIDAAYAGANECGWLRDLSAAGISTRGLTGSGRVRLRAGAVALPPIGMTA